ILDQLRDGGRINSVRSPSLLARMLWLRGLTQMIRGSSGEGLTCYRESLPIFERLRESENQAAVHDLLAEALDYMGGREEARSHRESAVSILTAGSQSPWLPRAIV